MIGRRTCHLQLLLRADVLGQNECLNRVSKVPLYLKGLEASYNVSQRLNRADKGARQEDQAGWLRYTLNPTNSFTPAKSGFGWGWGGQNATPKRLNLCFEFLGCREQPFRARVFKGFEGLKFQARPFGASAGNCRSSQRIGLSPEA